MRGGVVNRVFCMMDTNACSAAYNAAENHVTTTTGFTDDQISWFKRTIGAMKAADPSLSVSMAYHVPNYGYMQAKNQYATEESKIDTHYYTLGLDIAAKAGDFGSYNVLTSGTFDTFDYVDGNVKLYGGEELVDIFKSNNVDSVFCGHEHQVSTSINYEGIRWTFGLKTGIYDIPEWKNLGGTAITLNSETGALSVSHVYFDPTYQAYKDKVNAGEITGFGVNGLAVMSKTDNKITVENAQKGTVTKEVIGGENAYKLSSDRQCKFTLDPALIDGNESVTFSYYVPSTTNGFYGAGWRSFGIGRGSANAAYYFLKQGEGTYGTDYTYYENYDTWYTATVPLRINDVKIPEFSWLIAKNGGELYIKDISVSNFRTTGNIAPTAADKNIVSSYSSTGFSRVNNANEELHFWSHSNTVNHMVFDSNFVQNCYNSGLTEITFTFYMDSSFVNETWSSVYFGYLDSSNTMQYFKDGSTYLGATPIRKANVGKENSKTASFTLTKEMYDKIDFASGARFVLGNLAAGSNDPLKMIITHLEFSTPKA